MSVWGAHFSPAEYGPIVDPTAGPWRTLIAPNDTAPQDLAATEVLHFLRFDTKLRRVFEDRFVRTNGASIPSGWTFPLCAVYVGGVVSGEMPTNTSIERTSIVISTFWDVSTFAPLQDGEGSISTVLGHIARVLRATRNRVLTVYWDEVQTALAENNMSIEPLATESFGEVEDRPMGRVDSLRVQYDLKLDKNTGQFTRLGNPPT